MSLYPFVGLALFVLGLLGFILKESLVHKLISLNIFLSGIFLFLVSQSLSYEKADSVATALVLTGLVVTLGVSAFGLMLIRASYGAKR
ncbi:MAG: NADH-quinone oxidoreductase subunit K [Sulfurimonas sp.]|nr:NADH-quinone oxidoreductase subunit K [Sulfurimonas sp.]